jgi:transposase, IS30 family
MWKHLTLQDRETIAIQLWRWSKQYEIAKVLKRSKSSISREIKNNSVIKEWSNEIQYLAIDAHHKAYLKRRRAKTQSMKINMNTDLKTYIILELERKDIIISPKIIAFSWNQKTKDKSNHITHESIYKWLEKPAQDKYRKYLLYNKGYKKNKAIKWSRIIGRVWLDKRNDEANNRTEQWHFEADLIVSNKWNKSAILTLTDRKTRLPRIFKLKDKSSENIMNIIASIKDEVWIKSVTFDNWMEFALHSILIEMWIKTFFCEPYHSWEKWSIENLNRIIRRWFPKWTNFGDISHEEIERVCNIIADSPREILGFLSPNQVHFS